MNFQAVSRYQHRIHTFEMGVKVGRRRVAGWGMGDGGGVKVLTKYRLFALSGGK